MMGTVGNAVNSSESYLTRAYVDSSPWSTSIECSSLSLFFQAYPDYFTIIKEPIALSILRKRANSGYYKTVLQFRDDYRLMFNNARKYNQEGSWVYVDAEEMEKVFNAAWDRAIVGSDLPGAPPTPGTVSATGSYASALTPMDDDDRPPLPTRGRSAGRKQVISDEEYLTPSDDE